MSQYQTGTVNVTNGSNVVTGSGTAWDVNVAAGDLFKVSGEAAIYEIASVDSATQITLTANYAGATNTGLSYAIIRDFTVYYSLPKLAQGDIDLQDVFNRAVNKIDQYMGFRKNIYFLMDDIAASQTAVRLFVVAGGQRGRIMLRSGSILAIGVRSSEARTAGTLTVEVYVNGAATGLTAVLDATNTTFKVTTQAKDMDAFVAGDQIDARITTDASWAPTTADIDVTVEIEEDEY